MCHVTLQFIVGCVHSSANEITLLETDSADYITGADAVHGIASVRSAGISGVRLQSVLQIHHRMLRTVRIPNAE